MNLPTVEEINRELAKRSLAEFMRQAWPILEPAVDLMWNWHIDVICEHLEAVKDKTIRDLIINIPPRCSKSMTVSVMYPAWYWLSDPSHKFVCVSHTDKVALDVALPMRRLIQSQWYQDFFKDKGGFFLDKDTEHYFSNNFGGYRQSYSSTTNVAGITANTLLMDDPMSSAIAFSKLERERVSRNLTYDYMSRLTPPGQAARVIIMQRQHPEDTSGAYLKHEEWDRIILPARWTGIHRSKTKLGFRDPRTQINESVFPGMLSQEFMDRILREGTDEGGGLRYFATQYQQDPAIMEGSIVKYEDLRYYKELPHIKKYSISCDTAIKTGQHNDFSVIMLWGEADNGYYCIDMIEKKLEYTALKQLIQNFYDANPAQELIIEDKASGQQLVQDFRRFSKIPVVAVMPGRDMPHTKTERLNFCSSLFEAGKVFIPEDASWKMRFSQQICEFSEDGSLKHDDIVDATTQYLCRAMSRRNKSRVRIL